MLLLSLLHAFVVTPQSRSLSFPIGYYVMALTQVISPGQDGGEEGEDRGINPKRREERNVFFFFFSFFLSFSTHTRSLCSWLYQCIFIMTATLSVSLNGEQRHGVYLNLKNISRQRRRRRRRRTSCGEWEEGKLNARKRAIKRDEE